jgi:hypothetical protein
MDFLLPVPTGINYWVQMLQQRWYEKKVKPLWAVNDSSYNCFGLAVRNKNQDGYIPQFYQNNIGYLDGSGGATQGAMFFEDTLAAVSFMSLVDPLKDNQGTTTAKVQWVFFVDLSKITPGGLSAGTLQGQRAAEIVINDVKNFVQVCGCGFRPHDVNQDLDNVLKRYSGILKKNTLVKDMYPRFCFTLDMSINYDSGMNATPPQLGQGNLIPQSLELYIKAVPDLTKLIQVGYGQFIQQEYAPTNVLIPMLNGAANGFLAGRKVMKPFIYDDGNNPQSTSDGWNGAQGSWDRTGKGVPYGFNDGDTATITALIPEWN